KLTRYQDLIEHHLSHFTSNEVDNSDWNVANMLNARYIVDFGGEAHLNPEAYGNAWFVDKLVYADGADAEMAALDTISPLYTAVADKSMEPILGKPELRTDSLDYIRLTTYAPDRLTYTSNSANGGVAVFSEVYFPWGWSATIDGQPVDIARVDYLLRAIKLPAGRHTVEMTFDPESLHTTEGIAYASVSIIYLILLIAIAAGVITALNAPAEKKSKK
ncbi:MAG: YfhO family protein, partial [Paramuribaculum sp.]|nr:YfhO family protein [Paramuribaculum sp.]